MDGEHEWDAEQLALSPSEMTKDEWLQLGPPTPTPAQPVRPPLPHAYTWAASGQPAHPFFSTHAHGAMLDALAPAPFGLAHHAHLAYPVPPPPPGRHRSVSSTASAESASSTLGDLSEYEYASDDAFGLSHASTDALDQAYAQYQAQAPFSAPQFAALSIDPKLFRPRERDQAHASRDGDAEGDDALVTARPKVGMLQMPDFAKSQGGAVGGGKKKVSHARKQNANHIPRPRNAFILFRKHVVDQKLIPASVEMRHQNVSIITAKMWREAPAEQKAHFNELARVEKEEHMRKYPGYRYQPVYRRTNVIRRRVRKDAAEEEKCRSVAELLLQGKSGDKLEEEIHERTAPNAPARKKAAARRGSAIELSKGALRALRAQAKAHAARESSTDWSDTASAVSHAHAHAGRGHSRRPSLLSRDASAEPAETWAPYAAPAWHAPTPVFTFPVAPEPQYGYAQPLALESSAFTSFDAEFAAALDAPTQATGGMNDVPYDIVFGAWNAGLEPSPTGLPRPPRSARWDGEGAHMSAPGDVPLDALAFDEGLFSFEHALAQADEVAGW
ncbi:hypothetical protein Q5752_002979 [Cryptotrichosporon argae]